MLFVSEAGEDFEVVKGVGGWEEEALAVSWSLP